MSSNPAGTIGRLNNWKTRRDNLVVEDGFNVRLDLGDIERLAESIAENGVERSLLVQRSDGDKFVVRDGHRRLAAIDNAISRKLIDPGTFDIPLQIEDKSLTPIDLLVLMAVANDSKPLLPLEEATLYKRMRDEKMTIEQICKKVGRGDVHVRDRLALLDAAPEVVDAVKSGQLAATLAQQITNFAKKDKGKQAELVKQATAGKAGKTAVKEQVDPDKKRVIALRLKVAEIEEAEAEVKEKLAAELEAQGWKQSNAKELCDSINPKLWNIVKMIGAKTALAKLVAGAQPNE